MAAKFDQRVSFTSSDATSSRRFRDRTSRRAATLTVPARPAPAEARDAMRHVATAPAPRPAPVATPPAPVVEPPTPAADIETDGLRICARGDWCESRTVRQAEDGEMIVEPARTYQTFCQPDSTQIELALARLPGQYLWLGAEIGNPARNGRPIHVPFGPKLPIRVDLAALMAWIADSLTNWHERVADALDLTLTWRQQAAPDQDLDYVGRELSRARREVIAVRDAARTLIQHAGTLLTLPDGPMSVWADDWLTIGELGAAAAGLEILTLEYKARAVLGWTDARPEEILGVTCPSCDRLALRRTDLWEQGDDLDIVAICMWCAARIDTGSYRAQVKACAAAATAVRVRPQLENLPIVA